MQQKVNEAYKPLFTSKKRYKILMGGRGAGRSTVASQRSIAKLVAPEYYRCAIMRLVLGDIRNSIYREITDRADENGIKDSLDINDSQMVIEYGANTINAVGFKKSSGEQKAKLKSLANYTEVIIEEADEVSEEDFMQLDDSIRTVKADITIILLLNPPPKSHWIIRKWFDLFPVEGVPDFYLPQLREGIKDVLFIRTSYKDNIKNIDAQTIDRYEGYKLTKPAHYYNMICGYVPETVVGKIYTNWLEIDSIPHEARLIGRWLDFGYTNDPTACGDVYAYNGGYILDEQLYQTGLTNPQIANSIKCMPEPQMVVVADSSEPKSIDEIKMYGLNIQPAVKGQGSVSQGIQAVQSVRISYTKRSVNIKKEYESYAWKVLKDGETLNEPVDKFNHHMDGIRYVIQPLIGYDQEEDSQEFGLYKTGFK